MYLPKIGEKGYLQLYGSNPPIVGKIESIDPDNINIVTITLYYPKKGKETRVVDIAENGFLFYDAPLNSKYCYQVIEHHDNSHDAIDVREHSYFLDVKLAIDDKRQKSKKSKYGSFEVVVYEIDQFKGVTHE